MSIPATIDAAHADWQAVVLEYPNGRTHQTVLRGELEPGTQFVLLRAPLLRARAAANRRGRQPVRRTPDDPIRCTSVGKLGGVTAY